jgi:MFS family permease
MNNSQLVRNLVLINFLCAIGYSFIAPIYPPLAIERGVTADLIGLIFTIFPFVGIIVSPFVPQHMNKYGKKVILKYSAILAVYNIN